MNTRVRPASRDQALDAVCQFHAEHGRPPQQREWEHATPDRPCSRTIERRWGWRTLLAEAIGVEPDGLELWEGGGWEGACRAAGNEASSAPAMYPSG